MKLKDLLINSDFINVEDEMQIDDGVILRHVINHGGVPYSLLIINGVELLSCERNDEKGMLAYYQANKSRYLSTGKREKSLWN